MTQLPVLITVTIRKITELLKKNPYTWRQTAPTELATRLTLRDVPLTEHMNKLSERSASACAPSADLASCLPEETSLRQAPAQPAPAVPKPAERGRLPLHPPRPPGNVRCSLQTLSDFNHHPPESVVSGHRRCLCAEPSSWLVESDSGWVGGAVITSCPTLRPHGL